MKKLELKIAPPILVAIIMLLMWGVANFTSNYNIVFGNRYIVIFIAVFLGMSFMASAVIKFTMIKTTINPMKPENATSLVTSGLYRFSRNPIYLADLLFIFAWGLYLSNPFSLVFCIIFILYMNRFQITPEERFLEEKFGNEFLAYKQKVRRWI